MPLSTYSVCPSWPKHDDVDQMGPWPQPMIGRSPLASTHRMVDSSIMYSGPTRIYPRLIQGIAAQCRPGMSLGNVEASIGLEEELVEPLQLKFNLTSRD